MQQLLEHLSFCGDIVDTYQYKYGFSRSTVTPVTGSSRNQQVKVQPLW